MSRRHSVGSPSNEANSRLNRHFASCATIAAGMAILGLADISDAAVVSRAENLTGDLYINLDTGVVGTTAAMVPGWDINLQNWGPGHELFAFKVTNAADGLSNIVTSSVSYTGPLAAKLDAGVTVAPSSSFLAPQFLSNVTIADNYYAVGDWLGGATNKFLGVEFTAADNKLHYAWLRLDVDGTTLATTLVDYAFETTANTAIVTGDTGTSVPEPSSAAALGVLALGAVGVRSRRRKAV